MKVIRFLMYVAFSNICPSDINPMRWQGMLKWLETRKRLDDGLDLEAEWR